MDRDTYLLALCRYVERNPVAARLVATAGDWPWSSFRAHVGQVQAPEWLDCDSLHGYLLGRALTTPLDRRLAIRHYAVLVRQDAPGDETFWQTALRGQVFMGDEAFVQRMQQAVTPQRKSPSAIPKSQRLLGRSWPDGLKVRAGDRNRAMHLAYSEPGLTLTPTSLLAVGRAACRHSSCGLQRVKGRL